MWGFHKQSCISQAIWRSSSGPDKSDTHQTEVLFVLARLLTSTRLQAVEWLLLWFVYYRLLHTRDGMQTGEKKEERERKCVTSQRGSSHTRRDHKDTLRTDQSILDRIPNRNVTVTTFAESHAPTPSRLFTIQ